MTEDQYATMAGHYDAAYTTANLADMPFYLELAGESGGPVLELGCGTGRMTLPIARQGVTITGVDISPAMLNKLQEKLQDEPEPVRRRVTTHEGNLNEVALDQKFPLIISPFRAMQHMYTIEDQLAALNSARNHLAPGGVLAFDVFLPRFEAIAAGVDEEILDLEWTTGTSGETTIRRYFKKTRVDKVNLNFSGTFTFKTFQGDRLVKEETAELMMSFYAYPHLQLLFKLAGLAQIDVFGDFDRTPLTSDSPEMIFLLKAAD